jgi:hypothetical protein
MRNIQNKLEANETFFFVVVVFACSCKPEPTKGGHMCDRATGTQCSMHIDRTFVLEAKNTMQCSVQEMREPQVQCTQNPQQPNGHDPLYNFS